MTLTLTPEQYAAHQKRIGARKGSIAPIPGPTGRDFPAAGVQAPKKYRNRPTGAYASAKEARRAEELKLMERAGVINNLREQVPFVLIPAQKDGLGKLLERACVYIADFTYHDPHNYVVEDVKSVATQTAEFRIKKKLMLQVRGIRLRIA